MLCRSRWSGREEILKFWSAFKIVIFLVRGPVWRIWREVYSLGRGWENRAAVGRGGAPIILGINDRFCTTILLNHATNHDNWTRRGWNRAAVGRGGAPIILGINDHVAPKCRRIMSQITLFRCYTVMFKQESNWVYVDAFYVKNDVCVSILYQNFLSIR